MSAPDIKFLAFNPHGDYIDLGRYSIKTGALWLPGLNVSRQVCL